MTNQACKVKRNSHNKSDIDVKLEPMSKNTTDELTPIIADIMMHTGIIKSSEDLHAITKGERFIKVHDKAKKQLLALISNREKLLLDRVEKEITDKVTTTTIQNIHPLKNGHYVRTDNLIKMLATLRKELDGGSDE